MSNSIFKGWPELGADSIFMSLQHLNEKKALARGVNANIPDYQWDLNVSNKITDQGTLLRKGLNLNKRV